MGHIGTKIRERRDELGWTLKELHEKTGVSENYLGQIERGERPRVSRDIIVKIEKALDMAFKSEGGEIQNEHILRLIILTVNQWLNEEQRDLTPDKRADLILILYRHLLETGRGDELTIRQKIRELSALL